MPLARASVTGAPPSENGAGAEVAAGDGQPDRTGRSVRAARATAALPPAAKRPSRWLRVSSRELRADVTDAWVVSVRNLRHFVRQPDLLLFSTIQPIMFVLLFTYVLLGRTLADLVRNVLIIGLMIAVGYVIGFRFHAGLFGAIASVAVVSAFGFALSWIFAFVALSVRGAEAAQSAGFVILFPLVFASSVFVPVSTLPSWLQAIAKVSPVTLTANAARSFALVPGTPSSLGGAIAWIAGLLAVFIPLSVWRYRRMT